MLNLSRGLQNLLIVKINDDFSDANPQARHTLPPTPVVCHVWSTTEVCRRPNKGVGQPLPPTPSKTKPTSLYCCSIPSRRLYSVCLCIHDKHVCFMYFIVNLSVPDG